MLPFERYPVGEDIASRFAIGYTRLQELIASRAIDYSIMGPRG